jgi:hypothetical protein
MTRHVSDESLADLAEGGGAEADRVHAAGCGRCAARVEEARAGLALARRADVPEPSPLYWEAMRRNVGRRIAEEPHGAQRWLWLVPVASAVVAVAVVVFTTGRTHAPTAPPADAAGLSACPAADDVSLEVLRGWPWPTRSWRSSTRGAG